MLKFIFTKLNFAIYIILFLIFTFSISFAQTKQVVIAGVYDPTGPNTVNLNTLPTYVGPATNLSWSPASNSSYYTAQVSTDSTFTNIIASNTTSNLSTMFSGLPEGQTLYYKIIPYTSDNRAGLSSNIVFAITDKTPPTTQIINSQVINNEIKLDYNASDNLSGIQNIYLYYRFNNNNWINYGTIPDSLTYNFIPQDGNGTYDFLTIGIDKVGNIEVKSLNPESTINFISQTSTPTPTQSPTISILPTQTPVPSTIPPKNNEIQTQINIFTLPSAKVEISFDEGQTTKYSANSNGVFTQTFKTDNYNNIFIKVRNSNNEIIYTNKFIIKDTINIITAPVFQNYYINHNLSDRYIVLKGQSFPNSKVILFNFNDKNLDAVTDKTGNFTLNVDLNELQMLYSNSIVYDSNKKSLFNYNLYATSSFNRLTSDNSKNILMIITADPSLLKVTPTPTKSPDLNVTNIKKQINNYIELNKLLFEIIKIILFIDILILTLVLIIQSIRKVLKQFLDEPLFLLFLPITPLKKYGKIYNAKNGKPLPFIKVQLFDSHTQELIKTTLSNTKGEYFLEIPDIEKQYFIRIQSHLFKTYKDNIEIKEIVKIKDFNIVEDYIPVHFEKIESSNLLAFVSLFISEVFIHLTNHLFLLFLIFSFAYYVITDETIPLIMTLVFWIIIVFKFFDYLIHRKINGKLIVIPHERHLNEVVVLKIKEMDNKIITDIKGNFKILLKKGDYNLEIYSHVYEFSEENKDLSFINQKVLVYNVKNHHHPRIFIKHIDENI